LLGIVPFRTGRRGEALAGGVAPGDVIANTSNVVPDGKGGYWFGDAAILTGSTWASESFLQPASVQTANSAIPKPTLYRFDF
jgi:hypothetical protein